MNHLFYTESSWYIMVKLEFHDPIYVVESKKRCEKMGLDPKIIPTPQLIPIEKLNRIQYQYKKVFDIITFFADKFFQMVEGIPILLVITDDERTVLEIKGD